MKKLFLIILLLPALSFASSGGFHLMQAKNDLSDKASLQRGAKTFVNYCLSCHEASYMRYNRMAKDLGLTESAVAKNLMFASEKVGETMTVAMTKDDANLFFGTTPPDLSVVARSRGTDWLFTYLMTFYKDDSRPFGVNNAVFDSVGMPHVLWQLQGEQEAVIEEHDDGEGNKAEVVVGVKQVSEGTLTAEDYKRSMRDLVNFLDYMGEPAKLVRYSLGVKVLVFLVFFFFLAYALKKEYWKDIH